MSDPTQGLVPYAGLPTSDPYYAPVPVSGGAAFPVDAGALPMAGGSSGALSVMNETQLAYLERETRIKALTAVSLQQNAVASEWLRFRQPYERNIRIDTRSESREKRWLFARGERLRVTTTINIW